MTQHSVPRRALIIATFVFFVITVFINIMATGPGVELGMFLNSTNVISDKFYLEITPASWTFSVWGFIYLWQALWLVYCLAAICRVKATGFFYKHPVLPASLFVVYCANQVCNIIWLFLWDREQLGAALPFIALTPATLYACLVISTRSLQAQAGKMAKQGLRVDVWLVRLLMQNGIGFYAGWVSVATLLNLAMVIIYDGQGTMATTCGGILVAVGLLVLGWLGVDLFLLDRYTRYLFSPYLILVVAFSGIVARNYGNTGAPYNSWLMAADLGVVVIALVVKVVVMVMRHFRIHLKKSQVPYQPTV